VGRRPTRADRARERLVISVGRTPLLVRTSPEPWDHETASPALSCLNLLPFGAGAGLLNSGHQKDDENRPRSSMSSSDAGLTQLG
jgi:hypothetical protein